MVRIQINHRHAQHQGTKYPTTPSIGTAVLAHGI